MGYLSNNSTSSSQTEETDELCSKCFISSKRIISCSETGCPLVCKTKKPKEISNQQPTSLKAIFKNRSKLTNTILAIYPYERPAGLTILEFFMDGSSYRIIKNPREILSNLYRQRTPIDKSLLSSDELAIVDKMDSLKAKDLCTKMYFLVRESTTPLFLSDVDYLAYTTLLEYLVGRLEDEEVRAKSST